ncbi:AAA family ATPase [Oceanivirga salmonicida]|uniref:AAA family ATPase n=1 Tax=Oceanivirga salmonicida TaxID=1769291 RepID=UPI00082CD892|nr:AAA family ATPase [Oceanivirga salmonicida]
MIIMNIELDNIYSFNDFKLNFSYPKKIVNNTIRNEFLVDKPNFRYKKVNILMGSNATGKSTLGKSIMKIFNFINKKELSFLEEFHNNKQKKLKFSLDYINNFDINYLYRINCEYIDKENVKLEIYKSKINKTDSYEKCIKKFEKISDDNFDYLNNIEKIKIEGWNFSFPDFDFIDTVNLNIFNKILKTLDNTVKEVIKSKEVKDTYIISFKNRNDNVIVQNGKVIDSSILSTGTKSGMDIASILTAIYENRNGFYYCDEKFSFINSEIEKTILSLMIEFLHDNTQLFFTTHNIEILDMDLPIHSFIFLNKRDKISVVNPEKYIKKNDVSLKNALQNEMFDFEPNLEYLYILEEELKNEK